MDKYEQWANEKFQGRTQAELREAGEKLGHHFGPNASSSFMRNKLLEVIGSSPEQPQPEPKKEIRLPKIINARRPGLAPGDKWEGRRHRVVVHKGPDDGEKTAFVLYWNGAQESFPYGKECNIPEPFFNSLRNTTVKKLLQRPVKNAAGELERMESYDVVTPLFAYNYMGVTPGTEELPGSILEYWQRRAKSNNYFKELAESTAGRKILIQILSDITEPKGFAAYRDLTNEDILVEVLRYLGFEDILYGDIEEALVA